jgi:hypothetical protein
MRRTHRLPWALLSWQKENLSSLYVISAGPKLFTGQVIVQPLRQRCLVKNYCPLVVIPREERTQMGRGPSRCSLISRILPGKCIV